MASDRAEQAERRVCVGAIAGAFGVRGEVRLKPFTAEPEAIAAYGPVETEDGARRFSVSITRAVKGGLAARLSGVAAREEAEALRGQRLYVPRAALPDAQLEEEEYYHADLIGLRVEDLSGASLGRVTAVWDFGAGDMLEIAPDGAGAPGAGGESAAKSASKGGSKNVYLPFTRAAVPHVDLAASLLIADPPGGVFGASESDDGGEEGGAETPEPSEGPR